MGHARAVDIGIEQANAAAGSRQADCDRSRDCALAHAPLARADRNHGLGLQADLPDLRRRTVVLDDVHGHLCHRGKPGAQQFLDPGPRVLPEDRRMRCEGNGYRDRRGPGRDIAHLPHLDEGTSCLGVGDAGEHGQYGGAVDGGGCG